MRILYIDCDSLRPDHLGCYGYERNTSPNIDRLAEEGRHFRNCYTSDAPCLPSRTAHYLGQFGVHTGVINHGGMNADLRPQGADRHFGNEGIRKTFATALRQVGHRTAMVSSFPTRHAAWHVLDGFQEWVDPSVDFEGRAGTERADTVVPVAERWLRAHGREDDWLLVINFWDPHIPYDTPLEYGNPVADDPAPDWPTEEVIREHRKGYGPRSARDIHGWGSPYAEGGGWGDNAGLSRTPSEIGSRGDFEEWIDGYDVGIHFMDEHIGQLFDLMRDLGIFEDTLVIVSADHGENQGELNVYGDHQTADDKTCRVPLVVRGPGVEPGVDEKLHYQLDLGPTLVDLAGGDPAPAWDGRSFADALTGGKGTGRAHLVLGQGAWSCQRAVRWDDWLLVRTYHGGLKQLDPVMLFDLMDDPHEQHDIAADAPEVVAEGTRRLETWFARTMDRAARGNGWTEADSPSATDDPLWNVVREGGPYHAMRTGSVEPYLERLRETGRADHAETLIRKHDL